MSDSVSPQNEMAQTSSFDLKRLISQVIRLWPWFMISLPVCFIIAFFYIRYTPPVYKAAASILIKQGYEDPLLTALGQGRNMKNLGNEVEVMRSFDMVYEVVKASQLYLSVKSPGRIGERYVYGDDLPFIWEIANPDTIRSGVTWFFEWDNGKWMLQTRVDGAKSEIKLGQWYKKGNLKFRVWPNIRAKAPQPGSEAQHKYEILISPLEQTVLKYQGALSVLPLNKFATILQVTLTDNHPIKARVALSSIISAYNQESLDDKNLMTSNTLDFLTDRLQKVEDELKSMEGQVEQFKARNQINEVSSDARQYLQMSATIDQQKAQHETEVNVVNALEKELLLNQENPRLVPSTLGISEPSMAALIARHNDLLLQKQRVEQKAGSSNPLLVDLNSQIKDVRMSLIENVKNLKNAFNIQLADIKRKDAQLNSRIRTMPSLERNFVQITRDQTVKQEIYLFLLQKREEAAVTLASNTPDVRNIDKARNLGQIAPVAQAIWFVAGFFGLLFPILILVLREMLESKVGSAKEVQKKTMVPLLGEVSYVKKMDSPIPVSKGGRSVIAEQFRTLRTAITYTGKDKRVIMVTSHRPGEGKSFTSINMAASYALLNKKVVLLEFDLRKPGISKTLGIQAQTGISSILAGEADLDDVIMPVPQHEGGNLFLMPAGPLPPNPAELIVTPQMEAMINDLKERFDYIIIDTPPFSIVTDANLLLQYADLSIVVLRQGYTFKEVYELLNLRLQQFPGKSLYTVLNGVGKSNRYDNGTYGYGYNAYGYSDGYFEGPKKGWRKKSATT